jgi:N-methylhydantoinase B
MEQIADEMDATLFRAPSTRSSPRRMTPPRALPRETGDTLVQGKSGLPIFVGVMSFAVKAVIDKAARRATLPTATSTSSTTRIWAARTCRTCGWCGPISATAELFCYLASVGHWHDVGGAVPGNYNPSATEAFQEAFVLPPVKLARAGEVQQDIIDILLRNTRLPQSAMGDLNGQLGALDLGVKRLDALLDEYGARDRARRARRAAGPGRGADAGGADRPARRAMGGRGFPRQ